MSVLEIRVLIEDPAPPHRFGVDIALYSIGVTIDGEEASGYLASASNERSLRLSSRDEMNQEIAETVGAIIAHRGWPLPA